MLLFFSTILLLPSGGLAAEIEHRVVIKAVNAANGGPVKADIWIRSLEIEERMIWTTDGTTGKYEASPFECGLAMAFRAVPVGLVYSRTNDWKGCVYGEIVFQFSRTAYAPIIERTLKIDFEQFRSSNPELYALGNELLAANDSGAVDRIPLIATDLSARLTQAGMTDLSNDVSVVAFQAANLTLGVVGELAFDPSQDKYLFTDASVNALKEYQRQVSLDASGSLDWSTASAMAPDYSLQHTLGIQLVPQN